MYLNKLLIKDFGKFNNREINFEKGINIVYGAKESGKTTIRDFVVSMFYGIDHSRSYDNSVDIYEKFKPADRKGFSGKAYIQSNNNRYYIERSFLRRKSTLNVMDIQLGREVRLDTKDSLLGTLVNVDKETYINTLCINHPDSDKVKYIAEKMDRDTEAFVATGSKRIDKGRIIERLNEERSKFDLNPIVEQIEAVSIKLEPFEDAPIELKKIKSEIKELDEEFATEAARRKREARKMIETESGEVLYKEDAALNHTLNKVTQNEAMLDAMNEAAPEKKKKLTDRLWFIFLTGLVVIGAIALMVNILGFDKNVRQLFIICTVLFVVVTIVEDFYLKGFFDYDISTPSEEEFLKIISELEEQAAAESDDVEYEPEEMSFATEYTTRKAELREKEKKLTDDVTKKKELEGELENLQRMKEACEKERKAITFAIETLNDISSDINEELFAVINGNTADIVTKLTGGKCTDIRYDKKEHLLACVSGDYIGISELGSDLIKDVNLALDITIARQYCRNRMPVILDDVIEADDSEKLLSVVECLNTIETEQLIILSSNKELADKLTDIDIAYNMVEL